MNLRDKLGRFISPRKVFLEVLLGAVAVMWILYMITNGLVSLNNWSKENGLQKPVVILTNYNSTLITVIKQPITYKREPLQVLSPLAKEIIEEKPIVESELNEVEKEILEVFGVEDYKVARAIAKAESGLREDAFHANDNGTIDLGIFQINSIHFHKEGCSMKDLVDYKKNIACAKQIYDEQGFSPWVVFQTGAFKGNL